jgi:protoporphyrin/coproporphyrin ferrochelatase
MSQTSELPDAEGVLLTAHGSVEDLDELPEFLKRIRHGRPAPPELVAEVRRRYEAIGGSPLLRITEQQAALLSKELGLPAYIGMRLSKPELAAALDRARGDGVRRLCVLPLAPYSVHVYAAAAEKALGAHPHRDELSLVPVAPFGTSSELVSAHASRIREALSATSDGAVVVLTAHSLPQGVIDGGDPYQREFELSARAIGAALGRHVELAYQSQGFGGGAWLGPDLKSVFEAQRARGVRDVVVAPVGFLADHVETLYDLAIEAKAWADELGLGFTRVSALNTAPGLIDALAAAVRRALFR